MPADSVSPLSTGKGPGIRMDIEDHRQTSSWGTRKEAVEWRSRQADLIRRGKFKEAQQMDIDDVRARFGNKYDDAIKQMEDYTHSTLTTAKGN